MVVYVNDIVLIGNDEQEISNTKAYLQNHLYTKDLGKHALMSPTECHIFHDPLRVYFTYNLNHDSPPSILHDVSSL